MRWWNNLDVPKATLAFTVFAALCGGAWTVFTYIYPPAGPPITPAVEKQAAQSAKTPSPSEVPVRFCYGELPAVCQRNFPGVKFDDHIPCYQTEYKLNALCSQYSNVKQEPSPGISGNRCGYTMITALCVKR
jgi:hypothetical protein